MRHPMAERRVVYEIPNMTSATVRDVEYRRDGDTPLTMRVVNHPTGTHAFDLLEDSHASRVVICQALEFFRATLVEDVTVARTL